MADSRCQGAARGDLSPPGGLGWYLPISGPQGSLPLLQFAGMVKASLPPSREYGLILSGKRLTSASRLCQDVARHIARSQGVKVQDALVGSQDLSLLGQYYSTGQAYEGFIEKCPIHP